MQPNDLTDALSVLLNTLQAQLATPGARSEMLGAMQAQLLKGYLEEYVSLYNDAPLGAVLRDFPEQPMLGDAVAVLEHVVHRAQQRSCLHGGLLGFAGGLALDRGWGAQRKGMLKALLAAAFIYYILITPFLLGVGFGRYFVLFISELGFAAGWAIGVSDWHLRSPLQSLERRAVSVVESPAGGGI